MVVIIIRLHPNLIAMLCYKNNLIFPLSQKYAVLGYNQGIINLNSSTLIHMNFLTQYSIHKEMALIASRFQLHLISTPVMIEFTHHLMNQGFYDDVMLDIIEVGISHYECEEAFKKLLLMLNIPSLTIEQAKLIYSAFIMNGFATRPHNSLIFEIYTNSIFINFEEFFRDDIFTCADELIQILYKIDDAVDNIAIGYVKKGYNDNTTMYDMYQEFFQECHNWITRNQPQIQKIFTQIF